MPTYTCIDCGKEFFKRESKPPDLRRCGDCAIKFCHENMTQLHEHEGPLYEKWRKAMKAAAGRL